MLNLKNHLLKREAEGRPIKVGIIGVGRMGASVANQIFQMRGMKVSITADREPKIASKAYTANGTKEKDVLIVDKLGPAQDAIRTGKPAVAEDWRVIAESDVDVVLEAIGIPELGAEADITVGVYLAKLAENAGVVYSQASGDEPGVLKELYNFADTLGFTIVCLGKCPNFSPTVKEATPESILEIATPKGINPKVFSSFKDGTKTQVELTAIANACGLVPDVRGGHSQVATVETLAQVYRLKKDGGILNSYGIVDTCDPVYNPDGSIDYLRSVPPGVFAVITTDHPQIRLDMKYLFMGDGPTYALYRPYHLASIEAPLSLAQAVLFNEPVCSPIGIFTDLITVAKKDLKPKETLDGGGGTVYGRTEKYTIAKNENLLPFGLAENIKMVKHVRKDDPIRYSDVELDENSFILKLRRLQDVTLG